MIRTPLLLSEIHTHKNTQTHSSLASYKALAFGEGGRGLFVPVKDLQIC